MIDIAAINSEISAAPKNSKGNIVNRYCQLYGVSRDTIYRMIRTKFGNKKEVKREKKIPSELIHEIAKIKMRGMQIGLSERELATDICIDILIEKQVPGAELLTISTVNRRLKELGFRMRDPIVRVEAEYANQQHQMDFSRSKYFQVMQFDNRRGDYLLKVSGKSLFYKQDDHRLRTWIVGLTDAFSRVSVTKAYAATGESVLIGIEFLNYVFTRDDDGLPLKYLPKILKTDNGAFIKDASVKALLEKLEIESELSEPYKKRGIQKRESGWKMLWQRFELKNAIKMGEGKTIFLQDYNELLHEFMIELLEWNHPVRACTRGHAYLTSLGANPPREISVDLREVIARPFERKVDQTLLISINNQPYECPVSTMDKWVRVYKNLHGEVVGELRDEYSKPLILKAVDGFVNIGDFSHRQAATYRQVVETTVNAERKEQRRNPPLHPSQEGTEKISYLKPRVEKFEPETKFTEAMNEEIFASEFDAKVYIGKMLEKQGKGKSYNDYADVFNEMLSQPDGLKKKYIDELLNYILNEAMQA